MNTMPILSVLFLSLQSPSATLPLPPGNMPEKQAKEETKQRNYLEYRNLDEGITFKIDNGQVEFTGPAEKGKGETRTFKAGSFNEFKRQYPELVKKYDLDRLASGLLKPGAMEKWWDKWAEPLGGDQKDRFGKFWNECPKDSPEVSRNMEEWFESEHRVLRDLERRFREQGLRSPEDLSKSHTAAFGILVGPVSDDLRSQLGLKPHEGLIVADVEKDSLAERSGVKKYDVLLTLSGQMIEDTGKFKEQMANALKGNDFVLELIRGGSHLKLTIHPAHS